MSRLLWRPSQRIVHSGAPSCWSIRGVTPPSLLRWPSCAQNSAADYSVDFAPLLGCGERIVEVAFSTDGGAIAWASIFGTLATAWIAWLSPGQQSAEVTALTSSGATLTGTVTVTVSGTGALLQARRQASLPDGTGVPPNAALAPDKTVLSLDAGHTWQVSLSDLLSPAGQPLLSPSGVRLRDQVFETRTNILLIA